MTWLIRKNFFHAQLVLPTLYEEPNVSPKNPGSRGPPY